MERILLGHGSGGRLMHDLIRTCFSTPFGIEGAGDSAIVDLPPGRLAFTTDSYVVTPLFFPGGNIGDIAVNGTINDLAVAGARPLYLTAGFVIEEGFLLSDLQKIALSMAAAARNACVGIVAGDTKVVNKGKADGVFINTSGIGVVADGRDISASRIRKGDAVIISGEIGCHGVSVLAERNGLTFDPPVTSDTRALNALVEVMYGAAESIHFMRDPTRGGVATTLKETAIESGLCIRVKERLLPVPPGIKGACSLLGLDPLLVANEGILIAIVDHSDAEGIVKAMTGCEAGRHAAVIGEVTDAPSGTVLLETISGGNRILDMLQGEQLPRIC